MKLAEKGLKTTARLRQEAAELRARLDTSGLPDKSGHPNTKLTGNTDFRSTDYRSLMENKLRLGTERLGGGGGGGGGGFFRSIRDAVRRVWRGSATDVGEPESRSSLSRDRQLPGGAGLEKTIPKSTPRYTSPRSSGPSLPGARSGPSRRCWETRSTLLAPQRQFRLALICLDREAVSGHCIVSRVHLVHIGNSPHMREP